jgi:predicted PurR-regulated permease PerM
MSEKNQTISIYDTSIRLLFLALVVAWCLMLLLPFGSILLWGAILAMAFSPIHNSLSKKLGGKEKLAATLIIIISLVVIIVPIWLFLGSIIEGVKEIKTNFNAGTLTIPAPTEKVREWPVIGEKFYELWNSAYIDIKDLILSYQEQIKEYGSKFVSSILSVVSGVFQMIVSIIIAGVLLVVKGANETVRKFFRKLVGEKGEEYADVAFKTIGNVVKGVLGVALIQAFLTGIGFLLAGVPFAGLWTLLVLILAILQIPAALIVIPVVVWIFSALETGPAVLWTIYLLAAGLSDNVLKPILLGQGAPVPMLVIFLGVIGGFIFSGFIGLFTGAIVMSIGYKLFVAWLD